jgi:tetratricopeptide (TPR) repeat protein
MNNLAMTYHRLGRLADAIPHYEAALKGVEGKLGPDDPHTLTVMNNLASAYRSVGRFTAAIPLYEKVLEGFETKLGPDNLQTLLSKDNLASAYQDVGRLADAIPLHEAALEGLKTKLGPDHPDTLLTMGNLARAYLAENPARAEALLRQAVEIRKKKLPDDWRTCEIESLLGASLLGQQKYAEAEPFLLEGYEGMQARQAKIADSCRKYLVEAGARIVKLYEAWGNSDEAEKWRHRLEQAKAP